MVDGQAGRCMGGAWHMLGGVGLVIYASGLHDTAATSCYETIYSNYKSMPVKEVLIKQVRFQKEIFCLEWFHLGSIYKVGHMA